MYTSTGNRAPCILGDVRLWVGHTLLCNIRLWEGNTQINVYPSSLRADERRSRAATVTLGRCTDVLGFCGVGLPGQLSDESEGVDAHALFHERLRVRRHRPGEGDRFVYLSRLKADASRLRAASAVLG